MRFFKSRKSDQPASARGVIGPDAQEAEAVNEPAEIDEVSDAPAGGPWDVSEAPEASGRIDLGAVHLPKHEGLQIRMELDKKTRRVVALNLSVDGSALQVQAFAAPRSEGIWTELREEIQASIGKQGGTVEEREGTFGTELLARLPVRMPDGRTGSRPARFLGVDGPRWFLRGVLTGKATSDAQAAEAMESIFASIVVDRGIEPRPPRELLTLHLPGQSAQPQAPTSERPPLRLPKRGPEITEVR